MSEQSWVEKRAHPREEVLRPGVIVHGRSGRTVPCRIIDLSLGGARLLIEGDDVPDQGLTLIDQHAGTLNDCQVVWRRAKFAGVRFVPAAESAQRKAQLRELQRARESGET